MLDLHIHLPHDQLVCRQLGPGADVQEKTLGQPLEIQIQVTSESCKYSKTLAKTFYKIKFTVVVLSLQSNLLRRGRPGLVVVDEIKIQTLRPPGSHTSHDKQNIFFEFF